LLEAVVADCFQHGIALNRAEIAERTGLSRTVVTSLVKTLVARGTLSIARSAQLASPGRPAVAYRLSTAVAPVALLRLDDQGTSVTLASDSGPVSTSRTQTHPGDESWRRQVLDLLTLPQPAQPTRVRRVVIAAPFPVAPRDWGNGDTQRPEQVAHTLLTRDLDDMDVVLVNDAHLAALGEAVHGAGEGTRAGIHLSVRHGIGAGLVFDGKLYTGADGTAGEIAHVQVVPDAPGCGCGNSGCLASQVQYKEADLALSALYGRRLTAAEADVLVADGDWAAVGYYQDLAGLVARALAGLVTVLAPEALVVDAELGPAYVPFSAALARGLAEHCPPGQLDSLRLLRGRLADAQAFGAAAYEPGP
jgi:predicted NBD/HSP70 family sugar kinase